ncbi:MAG: hypothetical protein DHS20C21_13820 [Gemmatimonadota bacterium]|nr:MAG: hypothetical protein DHS20C21_13820 [Gemmatimonadota bacterium]
MSIGPVMKILYGPPGTGKTWRAAREAVFATDPKMHERHKRGSATDAEIMEAHHDTVLTGRIKWVTFHPSYSYEDFVEGFRPIQGPDRRTLSFEVCKGPFRDVCDISTGEAFGPAVGEEIKAVGGGTTYQVFAANDQGWWLLVDPKRANQVGEQPQEKFVPRRTIKRAAELKLKPEVFSIPGNKSHKPSRYGLSGTKAEKGTDLRRRAGALLRCSSSDLANSSHWGAVANYIQDQQSSIGDPVRTCLVIDEINRADLSRVFGELITLLEPDKRIGAAEERRVHLPYSGEERFGVPSTLSIVGTMNTADRSISSMDFAMRRRFEFEQVEPDPELCPRDYGGVDLRSIFSGINRRLTILRGRDYRLGHSLFMEATLESQRESLGWPDDASGRILSVAHSIRTKIVPLLLEYFYDDWRKVEVALGVLGREFGASKLSLFEKDQPTSSDVEQFDGFFDAAGVSLGRLASWWQPKGPGELDEETFRQALIAMS